MQDDDPAAQIRELREKVRRMFCQIVALDTVVTSLATRSGMASVVADDLRVVSHAIGTQGAIHIDPIMRRLLGQLFELDRDATLEALKMTIDQVEQGYRAVGDTTRTS